MPRFLLRTPWVGGRWPPLIADTVAMVLMVLLVWPMLNMGTAVLAPVLTPRRHPIDVHLRVNDVRGWRMMVRVIEWTMRACH